MFGSPFGETERMMRTAARARRGGCVVRLTRKDSAMESGNLVLTRKVGQEIVIGKDIVVRVARIRGNRVTLIVVADKSVKVIRAELVEVEG